MRALADRLRTEGIDVNIDAYEPHPSEGWHKWMEKNMRISEKIILVMSDRYARDFEQEVPNHTGARYEGVMVSSILASNGVSFKDMAVGVPSEMAHVGIPTILSGCPRYEIDGEAGYTALYRWLTKQPAVVPPALAGC